MGVTTWISAGCTVARCENRKMFMNSWANISTSTTDKADAADPGEDGPGTMEMSEWWLDGWQCAATHSGRDKGFR